ncbi:MAG: DNA polymerase III subunit gamma/tau [Clostridiales bacterium]|nr:DNA polymerase III subunit gamma/tau [Clostridiales bacterium]
MYQVLYRKWRPRTFSDVSGQPHVTTALKNELRTGRLAHAYLFTGSRGTGKTSCAKILAKAVNCLSLHDGDPCNECDVCRGIDSGAILDVVEIDAASNNGVDSIRELREEVSFTPAVARYRVYIIDEVHMLSNGAFNALLKTLEEPPAHVIFILATTEVHKLPATILSRCQRFDFSRIPPEDIAARIQYIAGEERFTITDDAALLLARMSDGALRDALSLLDQCLSRSRELTADTVAEAAGIAGREHLYELSAAVREQNPGAALTVIDRLHAASADMERLCVELIDFYRHLMILRSVPQGGDLVVASSAELERLRQEAEQYELAAILHGLESLQKTLERLRGGASRRVEMETALLRLCTPELDVSPAALLRRITALERAVRGGAAALPVSETLKAPAAESTVPPAEPAAEAENPPPGEAPPPPESSAGDGAAEQPFPQWGEVLEALAQTCPPLHGVLLGSAASLRGDFLLIRTNSDLFKALVSRDGNKAHLTAALRGVTGRSYRIGVKNAAPEGATARAASPDPLADFIRSSRELGVEVEVK